MNVVIAGGGTGGHLFPALAVGEVLKERGHNVLIFISEKEVDALAVKGRTEFRFEKLPSIGMPALFSAALPRFLLGFGSALAACRKIYANFKPDAVLGMGGFTSTSPILAGKFRGLPAFLHESNAIPGKANRLNARMVNAVFLGFEECRRHFGGKQCEVTGTPIRRALTVRVRKEEALATFGLSPGCTTILVMGGSQGARGINESVRAACPQFAGQNLQFIHLTGPQDDASLRATYQQNGLPAHVAAFSHAMEAAYSAADLVIARSGAASLSEISHFSLPSILIPYPLAAEDHQQLNAEIFARAGAATVLKEAEITGEVLARAIRTITADPARLTAMGEHSRNLTPNNAATRVAGIIESYQKT